MNIGNIVLKKLKQEISSSEWERYIRTLNYDENASRSNLAQFYAPNMLVAKWIKTKYQDKIAHLFEVESDIRPKVIISVGKDKSQASSQQRVQIESEQKNQSKSTILNSSFTFESFIIGDSNQFAYTTAKSVAEKPL